jgi:mono/diheme cytochrome c family protein
MKRIVRVVIAAILSVILGCHAAAHAGTNAPELVERGRYLALAADCVVCHTAAGGTAYAGARPIETPFGVIYSRNLTPDRETGLGLWSDADFYRALHEGLSRDGSHLYPAFPYTYFTRISREDATAIKAFLDTLAPVRSVIPPNRLPWPLNQRALMAVWNSLFFRKSMAEKSSATGSASPPDQDRGAYLVEALGHCGACHTPKNLLGADKSGASFQGGKIENWLAPNNTGDRRTGLGIWSEDEIVEYLQTGRNARALAGGPMAEVVEYSTSKLTETDLHAIARYFNRLPAAGLDATTSHPDPREMTTGEAIFVDACAGCHQISGEAAPRAFAPLKGSAIVQSQYPLNVIRVILQGARVAATDARPTPFTMPAFAWKLDDKQVAAVATYVRNAWGNVASPVKPAQVGALRGKLAQEFVADPP